MPVAIKKDNAIGILEITQAGLAREPIQEHRAGFEPAFSAYKAGVVANWTNDASRFGMSDLGFWIEDASNSIRVRRG